MSAVVEVSLHEVKELNSLVATILKDRPLLSGGVALCAVALFYWQRSGGDSKSDTDEAHEKPPTEFPRSDPATIEKLKRICTRDHLVAMVAINRWDHQHIALPLSHIPLWFGTQVAFFALLRNLSFVTGGGDFLPKAFAGLLAFWGIAHDVPIGLVFAAHAAYAYAVSAGPASWCLSMADIVGPWLAGVPLMLAPLAAHLGIVLCELPFHIFFQKSTPRPSPPMVDIAKANSIVPFLVYFNTWGGNLYMISNMIYLFWPSYYPEAARGVNALMHKWGDVKLATF